MLAARSLLKIIFFGVLSLQFVFADTGTTAKTKAISRQDSLDCALVYAAGKNDLYGIQSLLRRGANPNYDYGWATQRPVTALSRAVSHGCYEASKLLLENGANPNVSGYLGKAEYLLVDLVIILDKDLRLLELLLDHNADPNFETYKDSPRQYTPLHLAAAENSIEAVEILLKHGANINAAGSAKNTPLFFAATNGHKKLGLFLLSKGADIDFFSACGLGKKRRVKEMLNTNPNLTNITDNRINRAPIFYGVIGGDEEIVSTLIDYGANVNIRAPYYDTMDLLANDDVNCIGTTPLHLAAEIADMSIVELLIRSGANLESRDYDGRTPLQVAVKTCNRGAVKALLEAGANVNAITNTWSPLTLCIEHCPDILPLVLDYDPSKKRIDEAIEMLKVRDDIEDREKKLELILEKGGTH